MNDLTTIPEVDLERYAGTWYEIARLPNRFENSLICVTATYTLRNDGKITVINKGYKSEKKSWSKIKGKAWVPNSEYPGRLKVRFFWPFKGDYYIIELNKEYSLALVGTPDRNLLWILSKDPNLSEAAYSEMVKIAKEKGFQTDRLIKVKQDCQ